MIYANRKVLRESQKVAGKRLQLRRSSILGVLLCSTVLLAACSEGRLGRGNKSKVNDSSSSATVEDVGAGADGQCLSNRDFFAQQVWTSVLGTQCLTCHSQGGIASREGSRFLLERSAYPGFLDVNFEALNEIASLKLDGDTVLLQKPLGEQGHGGGVVLKADGTGLAILKEFVRRSEAGDPCPNNVGSVADVQLELMSPARTLRKASLNLTGSLPSAKETEDVQAGGEEALAEAIDELFTKEAFYDRIKEIFNDRLFTDKYAQSGLQFVNADAFPARTAFNIVDKVVPPNLDRVQSAIGREPLELIAHVVRNDKPFSEILTAPYTVVNKHSAIVYGVESPPESEAFVEGQAQVVVDGGIQAYPHSGILTMPVFLARFPTTPTNRNRHRIARILDLFLATNILNTGTRPQDPTTAANFSNPTREDPDCVACHSIMDPMAGAFQKWNQRFSPGARWYKEMYPPGFREDLLPLDNVENGVQWLAERIVRDPRFVRSSVHTVFEALTSHAPLEHPEDPSGKDYLALAAAWTAQDTEFRRLDEVFVESNLNLKSLFHEILLSPYFRAVNAPAELEPAALVRFSAHGTSRLLTPEMLSRKLHALLGNGWDRTPAKNSGGRYGRVYAPTSFLLTDFRMLYGGIDSNSALIRLGQVNGMMSAVQLRLANEVSCKLVASHFKLPQGDSTLFPHVALTDLPSETDGEKAIRKNLRYLHLKLLDEDLQLDGEEIDRSYALFSETLQEGAAAVAAGDEKKQLANSCRGRIDLTTGETLAKADILSDDPDYALRAWMAVITYLLSDYRFLYEE